MSLLNNRPVRYLLQAINYTVFMALIWYSPPPIKEIDFIAKAFCLINKIVYFKRNSYQEQSDFVVGGYLTTFSQFTN